MKNITVTYVSSRDVARQHCADLVMQNADIDLIAIPHSLSRQETWKALSRTDVVVIDECVIQREGFAPVRMILDAYQDVNMLIVMELTSDEDMAWTLMQGVRGVMLETDIDRFLGKAIRRVYAGEVWMPRALVERFRGPGRPSPGSVSTG